MKPTLHSPEPRPTTPRRRYHETAGTSCFGSEVIGHEPRDSSLWQGEGEILILAYLKRALMCIATLCHHVVVQGKSIDDAQLRKFTKRTVDYGSDVVRWMEACALIALQIHLAPFLLVRMFEMRTLVRRPR